jgi:dTMP kinase
MKPFIVFEGTDGAGTTSHSKALVDRLQATGKQALWTCEPTKTPIGAFIRELFERKHGDVLPPWRAMTMLFQADREIHVQQILKYLQTQCVVSDRYWLSTLVYQALQAKREAPHERQMFAFLKAQEWIHSLNQGFHQPDILFVLDVPPEIAFRRKKGDQDLYEDLEMRKGTRQEYLNYSATNVVRISSNCPKEEVWDMIDEEVNKLNGF